MAINALTAVGDALISRSVLFATASCIGDVVGECEVIVGDKLGGR